MKKYLAGIFLPFLAFSVCTAQTPDTSKPNPWSVHFQLTVINQVHSGFKAAFSGANSLADTVEPSATSITTTLYLGRTLWKNAAFYFNPELSGGS